MKAKYTKKQIEESINYWQKQLQLGNYKKIDESNANEVVVGLWDEEGNGGPDDVEGFTDVVCSLLNTTKSELYEQFVPDEAKEWLDDYDTYIVDLQSTISEDEFWEQLYDRIVSQAFVFNGMHLKDFRNVIDKYGTTIAQEAWKEYTPSYKNLKSYRALKH